MEKLVAVVNTNIFYGQLCNRLFYKQVLVLTWNEDQMPINHTYVGFFVVAY